MLAQQLTETETKLADTIKTLETYRMTQALLTKAAEYAREQLIGSIRGTGTVGLQSVMFDKDVGFDVDITYPGGKASAEWLLKYPKGDLETEGADGGTLTDVVSLVLRFAMLELSRPKPQGFVYLDEPGKCISAKYLPGTTELIKQYLAKTGRQGILVTHHLDTMAPAAHRVYVIEQVGGVSRARLQEKEKGEGVF